MVLSRLANPIAPPRVEVVHMGLHVRNSTAAPRVLAKSNG
jgi:hypothetical protein